MNSSNYPNRDTLRKANDIYLDVMRSFIVHQLRQVKGERVEDLVEYALYDNQVDKYQQMLDDHNDVGSAIDFNFIPQIIKYHWDKFEQKFDGDLVAQNMLWLIRKGRNSCEHIGKNDLDYEFTRSHIYFIACILETINRTDKQREVVQLRDQFLSEDAAKKLSELTESNSSIEEEKNKYKNDLAESNRQIENLKKDQTDYKKQIEELNNVENEKNEIEKQLIKVEKEKNEFEEAWSDSEENLKRKILENKELVAKGKSNKKQIKSLNKKVAEIESQRDNAQKTLSSAENELATLKNEKNDTEDCLTTMQNLLTSITVSNPFFPPLSTDSNARLLDRRNTDKKSYILELLKLNKPSIFYVNSEEKINQFYNIVGQEKSNLIGKHTEQTSLEEEKELLEKLKDGELIAIVSNSTLSSDVPLHNVEHIVLCHPVLEKDTFIKRCQSAFTSNQSTYIHLIYEQKQTDNQLSELYPDRESLVNLYKTLNEVVGINVNFVKPEKFYNESGSVKLEYEKGFAIFEELSILERTEDGIKLLNTERTRDLEESEIYRESIQRNTEAMEFLDLQLNQHIEKIWEKIATKKDVNDEQDSITPPSAIMWSQKTLSAVTALRMCVRKDYPRDKDNSGNHQFISPHEPVDHLSNAMQKQQKLKLSVSKENGNYMNEYHIALQFVEVYGIRAFQHCIVQLITDKNDPDYEFSYLEKKMLCAFQMFLQDFNIESDETEQTTKDDALNTTGNTQENEITETKSTTRGSQTMVAVGTI